MLARASTATVSDLVASLALRRCGVRVRRPLSAHVVVRDGGQAGPLPYQATKGI
jgi:hypothetical protein